MFLPRNRKVIPTSEVRVNDINIGRPKLEEIMSRVDTYFGSAHWRMSPKLRNALVHVFMNHELVIDSVVLKEFSLKSRNTLIAIRCNYDRYPMTEERLQHIQDFTSMFVRGSKQLYVNKHTVEKLVASRKNIHLLDTIEEKRHFFRDLSECSEVMEIPMKELQACIKDTEKIIQNRFKLRLEWKSIPRKKY